MIGETFSHYRVLDRIGGGGMGEVYLAADLSLGRRVALKFLPRDLAPTPEAEERLLREARAAALLNHSHICTIHEIGEHEGRRFIVMELVEGRTLRDAIAGRRLPIAEVLDLGVQIADALDAAHAKGLIHRDIKPANVMVTDRGLAKVLDFGLAKLGQRHQAHGGASGLATEPLLTAPGIAVGTAAYMSPEQARGETLDARSDLFSLGAVLYEMATGKQAFSGTTSAVVFEALLNRAPDPAAQINQNVPLRLEDVISKALEKDRDLRYQTAAEIRSDLKRLKRDLESAHAVSTVSSHMRSKTRSGPWQRAIVGVFLAGVAIALGFWIVTSRLGGEAIDSVAVLPFTNESHDPETEYLSDGISEALIDSLAQLPSLRVISRTAAFQYKNKAIDPARVARELKVRALVTGRVLQRGDMLSIGAELVDTLDNRQLWGERYNRPFADVLALQEEIARHISERLRVRLTGKDEARFAKHGTANPEAYRAYLLGYHHTRKFTREGVTKGMAYFQRSLALDPGNALAHAGLGFAYIFGLGDWYAPNKDVLPKGKQAAEDALELDPSLGEAHWVLAMGRMLNDYDWAGAGEEFRRAVDVNPTLSEARQWYGMYEDALGRFDSGNSHIQNALEAGPVSPDANHTMGMHLYYSKRYDEAIDQLRRTLELDPGYFWSFMILGQAHEQKREFKDAIDAFVRAKQLAEQGGELPPEILSGLARCHAFAGDRASALEAFDELKALAGRRYVSHHDLALAQLALGRTEDALMSLERAYDDRNWWMPWLNVEPRVDSLRSHPRFQTLVRRMNFPSSKP